MTAQQSAQVRCSDCAQPIRGEAFTVRDAAGDSHTRCRRCDAIRVHQVAGCVFTREQQ